MRPSQRVRSADTAPSRIGRRNLENAGSRVALRHLHQRRLSQIVEVPRTPEKIFIPKTVEIPDRARSMGVHIMAGRGSGKSRLMGRAIAFEDVISGVPLILFDPMGSTIDNLLDKFMRMHPEERREHRISERLLYVDMSGRGDRVTPFPIYYRLGKESYYDVASRFATVVASLDPKLASAPILGLNALTKVSTYFGMLLAAMGCQITELLDMVRQPSHWAKAVRDVSAGKPDLAAAHTFFKAYLKLSSRERDQMISALEMKIMGMLLDPRQRAMFGADERELIGKRLWMARRLCFWTFGASTTETCADSRCSGPFPASWNSSSIAGAGGMCQPASLSMS